MGPLAAKSYLGHQVVQPAATEDRPVQRARQEINYGRRGKGYVFGALQPTTGATCTELYAGRTIANWVAFLERVDAWVDLDVAQVFAIVDNLSIHRATDVLVFCLAHPRWQFVF